ncbi:MAG: type II toxin-antitoxin system RelE/ParE family toxin [Gallionella sp.]
MPQINYSKAALADLERITQYLLSRDKEVAKRAIKTIRDALQRLTVFPESFRPVPDMIYHREMVIDFGSSGYIALFRHLPNGDITIARIKHQLENAYPQDSV